MPENEVNQPYQFAVAFGQLSIGDHTARIGIFILASNMSDDQIARHLFCGARLEAHMTVDPQSNSDAEGQETMGFTAGDEIVAIADCERFAISPKGYTAGLSFSTGELDPAKLTALAKNAGIVTLTRIGDSRPSKNESEGVTEDEV